MNGRDATRYVLVVPLTVAGFLLNVYFMWTAKVFEAVPSLRPLVNVAVLQMRLAGISCFGPNTPTNHCEVTYAGIIHPDTFMVDMECLLLLCSILVLAFLVFYRRGQTPEAMIRAVQIAALILMPLGFEIALFDPSEIWLHASTYLGPVSNADLLFLPIIVFGGTSIMTHSKANLTVNADLNRIQTSRLFRSSLAPFALAIGLGAALTIVKFAQVYSSHSFDWDSFSILDNARILAGYTAGFSYDLTRPPVMPLLVAVFFRLTQPNIIDGYAVSSLLFLLSGVGCYLLSREVMSRWISVIASTAFLTSPFVFQWAGISLTDVEGVAIAGLGLALLAIAAKERPRLYVLALPLLVVAPFLRYTMAIVFPLAIFYLALNRKSVHLRSRYFALGAVLAVALSGILYSVWVAYLPTSNFGPLFPSPSVSNPGDYAAFVAQIPNALGSGLYGLVMFGMLLVGLGLVCGELIMTRRVNPMVLTLLLWVVVLVGYYTFLWSDKSPLSVSRYSTEFVMPLVILSFLGIDRGVGYLNGSKFPWRRAGAVLVLVLLVTMQAIAFESSYSRAAGGVDVPENVGMAQVAAWIDTYVAPTNHKLLCTEWPLCWWYLPQYTILGTEDYQDILTAAPQVSYVIYDTSQFGGVRLNLTGVVPVWESKAGDYIIYKVGNGTALSQTYFSYTVLRGDTLTLLGQRYDIPWQDIAQVNDITSPYFLYPGQVLSIPLNNPTCLNFGITLPANDGVANQTYGAPAYAAEGQVNASRRVIIRFDDGYQDQWGNALPILAAYGYHAVFAVIDSYQTSQSICTPYESYQQAYYMNWAEVQWLAQHGNEISDHTWTHPNLNRISSAQLQTEIVYSRQALVAHGIDAETLTLPYGDGYGNSTLTNYILSNGFSYIYTVEGVENARQAIVPYNATDVVWHDIDISDNESLPTFESIVNQAGPNEVIGLTFHSVGNDAINDTYETNTGAFAADMAYLHQNQFDVILPWQLPGINLSAGQ